MVTKDSRDHDASNFIQYFKGKRMFNFQESFLVLIRSQLYSFIQHQIRERMIYTLSIKSVKTVKTQLISSYAILNLKVQESTCPVETKTG